MARLPTSAGRKGIRPLPTAARALPDLVETERVKDTGKQACRASQGASGVARPIHKASNELGPTVRHQPQGAIQCTQELHSGAAFWPALQLEHPSLLLLDALARFSYAPIGTRKPSILVVFGHAPGVGPSYGIMR